MAQKDPKVGVTVNDPIGPVPDPASVTATLPKDIKCTGTESASSRCACCMAIRPSRARTW